MRVGLWNETAVHLTPAFSEVDHLAAKASGLPMLDPIDADGRSTDAMSRLGRRHRNHYGARHLVLGPRPQRFRQGRVTASRWHPQWGSSRLGALSTSSTCRGVLPTQPRGQHDEVNGNAHALTWWATGAPAFGAEKA